MSHPSRPRAAIWLSFHIFLPGAFESFLVDHLAPALLDDLKAGTIKRFFFIRYSEGGNHIRLRLMACAHNGDFEPWLNKLVGNFAVATSSDLNSCRVEQHPYDRSELYFGETALSVYAELLNEQTSYLGLRTLAQYQGRQRLIVVLASILNFLLVSSTDGLEDFRARLEDSRRFAANTTDDLGFSVQSDEKLEASLRNLLLQLLPQSSTLNQDQTIQRILRLLRRTRKCKPSGEFVATHALHLLCNKLGISIVEEYNLFSTLYNIVADSFFLLKKGVDHGRMA
jgi:thiopeptide-type bacteriocin biosynthesis protein